MAAVSFALMASLAWGLSTFWAATATRRSAAAPVTFWSQVLGLVILLPFPIFLENTPSYREMTPGILAGLGSGASLFLLYAGTRHTPVGIVSAVSAVVSFAAPVAYSLVIGVVPSWHVLIGIGVSAAALTAVIFGSARRITAPSTRQDVRTTAATVLTTTEGGAAVVHAHRGGTTGRHALGLTQAAGSGVAMAVYYIALADVGPQSQLWPLAEARVGASILVAGMCVSTGVRLTLNTGVFWASLLVGVSGMAGAVLYIWALTGSMLPVAVALVSLSPAVTVCLGWLLLRERLSWQQCLGLLLAAVGVVVVVTG